MTLRAGKAASTLIVIGGAVAMSYAVQRRRRRAHQPVSRVITVGRPPTDLERMWADGAVRAAVFGEWRAGSSGVSAQFRPARPEHWGAEMTVRLHADDSGGTRSGAPA